MFLVNKVLKDLSTPEQWPSTKKCLISGVAIGALLSLGTILGGVYFHFHNGSIPHFSALEETTIAGAAVASMAAGSYLFLHQRKKGKNNECVQEFINTNFSDL